jgi:hypothetical protein
VSPTLAQALGTYAPVLVAIIASTFAYRQAVKVSGVVARTEGRKSDLAEYEALNRAQAAELERERTYRQEDAQRYAERIARLETRVTASEESGERWMLWAEEIVAVLRRPRVAAILADEGVTVPAAPMEPRREYV